MSFDFPINVRTNVLGEMLTDETHQGTTDGVERSIGRKKGVGLCRGVGGVYILGFLVGSANYLLGQHNFGRFPPAS